MTSPMNRLLYLIAVFAFGAVGLALISQYVFDMPPCAWCVMQRLIYLIIGIFALIGASGGRVLARLGAALVAVFSLCGVAAAWYQFSVAAKMLSCDQTFADRFMNATGLESAVPWLFGIYASCIDAVVPILGIEYAIWSLALFAILFFMALPIIFKRA